MSEVVGVGNYDDAVLVLIRDLVVRFLEQWGRPPSLVELKSELSGKRES